MKKIVFLFAILCVSAALNAQKDSVGLRQYPFVKFNNPTVPVHMKEGRYLTLHLYTDSGSSFTYSGLIYVSDPHSLLMLGGTEEYQGYTDAGNTYEERFTTNPADEVTVIPHTEIEYISLVPRFRPVFGTLVILSLVPIFICVPLASVGYNFKGLNTTKLVEVSAASLVANVALYKIFKVRKFRIKGSAVKRPFDYNSN